jgi:hypothetical protein
MEKYILKENIKLLIKPVSTFPLGITETFESLEQMLPDGKTRDYFGISYIEHGKIIYFAAAREQFDGEAKLFQCESKVVESGEYIVVPIQDWYNHLDSIKDVFHNLMQDPRADLTKPCIEWYKTMKEMWCMMKVVPAVVNGHHAKVSDKK